MRRNDREVRDIDEIFDILCRCDTIRIAMQGEDGPYIVPVSFGAERAGERVVVYFHCAREGKKVDMIRACPRVAVEADRFIRIEMTDHGVTTRYESVVGRGTCEFPEDGDEIVHGLRVLLEHYGYLDYDLCRCRPVSSLRVGRIVLDEITGKRNMP